MTIVLLSFLIGQASTGLAAVPGTPVEVSGQVRFTNSNPAVLSILGPPGNQGMLHLVVDADSTAPIRGSSSGLLPAASLTSSPFSLIVDADPPALGYRLSAVLALAGLTAPSSTPGRYYIPRGPAFTATLGSPVRGLLMDECASVLDIRYVDAAGVPVSIAGGGVGAVDTVLNQTRATRVLRAGATDNLVVPGDLNLRLRFELRVGSGTAEQSLEQIVDIVSVCDRIVPVTLVVPPLGKLGVIRGELDMLRELVHHTGRGTENERPFVNAWQYPSSNNRFTRVPTVPGTFVLENLLPFDLSTPAHPYSVHAQMQFRLNPSFEWFVTPWLGSGLNRGVALAAGADIDLGRLFVIDPGYLKGELTFDAPRETPTDPSPFRSLAFAEPLGGLPSGGAIYGNEGSTITARGVDQLAFEATYSAASGLASVGFAGDYHGPSDQWRGTYAMALGGLNQERSIWAARTISLLFRPSALGDPNDYVSQNLSIDDALLPQVVIEPNVAQNQDRRYAFGQVCVRFRSLDRPFWQPRLNTDGASYIGSLSNAAAHYTVDVTAYGTPLDSTTAATEGQVVLFAPAGHYRLKSFALFDGGETQLPDFEVDVDPRGQRCLSQCLSVDFDLPPCTTSRDRLVSGTVLTRCGNEVKRLIWRLDDGPAMQLCEACGLNPAFSFDVRIPDECGDHRVTVTAFDSNGEIAFTTKTVHYDNQPPVITCPKDIHVACTNASGTVVIYPAPTATDNCLGPVTIVCSPPSGVPFPLGESTVRCVATDACGNSAECKFSVTVTGDCESCLLTCPPDLVVDCTGPTGAVVTYASPHPSDACPPGSRFVCSPPSGSLFPIGQSIVVCELFGPSGNQLGNCKFTITVRAEVSIEPAVCVRWNCGTLQSAPDPGGPWTNLPGATSPYYARSGDSRRYYRVR